MRDMYMVTSAPLSGSSATIPQLTPEEELAARFRLLQALQTSQVPDELISLFYKYIQSIIAVTGITFCASADSRPLCLGRPSIHHCDYRLSIDGNALGEIVFSRNKRFSEQELGTLEGLLSYLVHPLRNAANHQAALRLATLDPLTLVGNRTALDAALRRQMSSASRHSQPLSVLMIDVDHFKEINDNYGHMRGDLVLKEVADTIQSVCRGTDTTFRYGGEEFLVLLDKTDIQGAMVIAERIRASIACTHMRYNGDVINVTVSIGIATYDHQQQDNSEDLLERADLALYRAKSNGRNRIINLA